MSRLSSAYDKDVMLIHDDRRYNISFLKERNVLINWIFTKALISPKV